jgi:hypothetical protein
VTERGWRGWVGYVLKAFYKKILKVFLKNKLVKENFVNYFLNINSFDGAYS